MNRAVHRDAGYLVAGLTLLYAVSGVAVNHRAEWNPSWNLTPETRRFADAYQRKYGAAPGILRTPERAVVERGVEVARLLLGAHLVDAGHQGLDGRDDLVEAVAQRVVVLAAHLLDAGWHPTGGHRVEGGADLAEDPGDVPRHEHAHREDGRGDEDDGDGDGPARAAGGGGGALAVRPSASPS